ncbi:MAG: T9SS type A sorting domain-containing protein [Bacteroidetes bacterium]|nr:T9SS type A sorting domain-containing protein [Bacteroidota bacterium]
MFKLYAFLLTAMGITGMYAQDNIATAGGNIQGIEGSVSYSVGQVAVHTHTGSGGSLAQGVQHPYEIYEITSVENRSDLGITISVYPNPVAEQIKLKINNFHQYGFSYQLYDIKGDLLHHQKVSENQTEIAVDHLVPATYIIRVMLSKQIVKQYKIIKK